MPLALKNSVGAGQDVHDPTPESVQVDAAAGRVPTEIGLRFFVDSLLEVGAISETERARIDAQIKGQAAGSPWMSLSRLSLLMSGQRLTLPAE